MSSTAIRKSFEGLVVQITGAASGFGALAARRFAEEGARLALSDKNEDQLVEVVTHLKNDGFEVVHDRLDVSIEADMSRYIGMVLEQFGQIDIGINNAGIGQAMKPITKIEVNDFDRMMAINARGVFLGMKYQLPGMLDRKSGAILNVASAAGVVGAGMLSAYAASKHAVVGLTKAAADEVARKNVRVNALCPSFASTPLFDEMADELAERQRLDRDEAYSKIATRIPMCRVAKPDEIVQAMLWACNPANSFMTGQALSIDGGLTAI
jgi:NAD(P)-dependent dehydrogenase (short-subunit alcohol dehydrogenase family)